MQTKICKKCGEEKELSEFAKRPRGKYGVDSWCKDCNNKKGRAHWIERAVHNLIKKCEDKGIKYDTKEELIDYIKKINTDHCDKCGQLLISGNDTHQTCSPSVDRIDISGGYTIDNIAILCMGCNRKKDNNTLEDFEQWVIWMKEKFAIRLNNQTK